MPPLRRILLWLTLFSIAMGFLESAVVIYLRELYYPQGFNFPLTVLPNRMALIEFSREAATIIMLAVIGIIAGRNKIQRFAFFIYAFAVWDLFYYVFLKLVLDWPPSLFTWDILFLIPVLWVGPVIAPCIIAFNMIVFTLIVIYAAEGGNQIPLGVMQRLLLVAGSLLVMFSFMWNYLTYTWNNGHSIWSPMSKEELFSDLTHFIPQHFNWGLFSTGEVLIAVATWLFWKSVKRKQEPISGVTHH